MTEPADQPLLEEHRTATKKPARKRTTTTKTRASTAKTVAKPKAKRVTKSKAAAAEPVAPVAVEAPVEAAPPAAPAPAIVAPVVAPPAPAPAPVMDEWRPSASAAQSVPAAPVPAPAVAAPVPAPTQPVMKPRPVYIPRHVAKQMEEQARAAGIDPGSIPVAVSAEEAARLDIPRVESFHRSERQPQPHIERAPRAERAEYVPFVQPEMESAELPPPREDEIGEAEGIVEVSGN